jgi:hypothetical protein
MMGNNDGSIFVFDTHVQADEAIRDEQAMKTDHYVLMVHGSNQDAARVRTILAGARVPLAA